MKLKRYENYCDSEIDWLDEYPSHWQLLPCRSIVNHIVEKNHKNEYQNYLSLMANVGVIRYEDKGDVGNKKPEDLSNCKIVKRGHLVINSMNYSIGSYGMSPYDGVCSSVYIILEAKPDVVIDRYALRVFENSAFQKHLATFGNGILAHRAAIGWDDIKGEYVPIPPIDEQSKIIEMLDHETAKIDTLIEKQQRLIELLTEKRQAVISNAVTKGLNPDAPMKDSGVEWLGEVPEHWEILKLKHLIKALESGCSVNAADIPAKYDEVGVLKTSCVYTRTFRSEENKTVIPEDLSRVKCPVREGAIIISRMNTPDLVGASALVKEDVSNIYLPDRLWQTIFDDAYELEPEFLAHFMTIKGFRTQISLAAEGASSSMQNIAKEDYLAINCALPPVSEQNMIVDSINSNITQFELLIEKANQAVELMQERRTALISAAVTGKIDVRDWVKPE